jgi:uncharacterized protein YndB with AHSA1/START domain
MSAIPPQPSPDAPDTIAAECKIDAPPETVWQILTHFSGYDAWNKLIYAIDMREFSEGQVFNATVKVGSISSRVTLKVHLIDKPHTIAWGAANPNWLLDAIRYQILTPTDAGGTHYQSLERFGGLSTVLTNVLMKQTMRKSSQDMADALKRVAESAAT